MRRRRVLPVAPPSVATAPVGGIARITWYGLAIGAATAAQLVVLYTILWTGQVGGIWSVLLGLPLFLAATQVSVAVVNWLTTLLVRPRRLPRLDLVDELPVELLTLVVVPTMLPDVAAAKALTARIEQHYLANRGRNVYFALLTDFTDDEAAHTENDDPILSAATAGVGELNRRYTDGPFLLLHRQRRYSPTERRWIGEERKRGKLADLNEVITGRAALADRFVTAVGPTSVLRHVRYVVTLDDDTDLPPGVVVGLVSVIAHPLNRPRHDPVSRRVVSGYGILQPRMDPVGYGRGASSFSRALSGSVGVDQYTGDVSDVYQDLFGEGSFVGKGIYDVDAVVHALDGAVPANRMLSHDLLEGCYARSGLVGDLVLTEGAPRQYCTDISRRSRWVRGDWQAAAWILPTVPTAAGPRIPNPLSVLSRWKLLDNLRRSLVKPSLLALAVSALVVPAPLLAGLLLAVVVVPLAPVAIRLADLVRRARSVRQVVEDIPELWRQLRLAALELVFLPYEGVVHISAIVRTWYRLATGQRLLEWVSTGEEAHRVIGLNGYVVRMWPTSVLGVACAGRFVVQPGPDTVALLVLAVVWLVSPVVAHLVSRSSRA